jgi:arylsulfate sulfotransferase
MNIRHRIGIFVLLTFVLGGCGSQKDSKPGIAGTPNVAPTNNPQVASYTITPSADATVVVQFGTDTNYGLTTSPQATPPEGGAVNILVAGMRAFTTYHMRAVVNFSEGTQSFDEDQVFTTGGLSANQFPALTITRPSGLTPQPGIELLDLVGAQPNVVAVDLSGNVIWFYTFTGTSGDLVQPVKLLPNGHFLVQISPTSSAVINSPPPPGTVIALREIDLAGITIREISLDTLNSRLAAAGFNIVGGTLHHDFLVLPNGHWIVLTNTTKLIGTTNVLGDVIVDLDTNLEPVWAWSTFDHLDVNRHPMNFPDWTHANALVYSPDDGNLLLSMRHQHWVIKIDYANGSGAGDVLWRLGTGGDFTLQGGTDPTDWFYAQHGPAFTTTLTSGNFPMVVFDNGNNRKFPATDPCTTSPTPACQFSTVPVFQIDEVNKTASIMFHDAPVPFSLFGGNSQPLTNGNIEFDECDTGSSPPTADVLEVIQELNPRVVWHLNIRGKFAYRAFRLPSLYPGVQW